MHNGDAAFPFLCPPCLSSSALLVVEVLLAASFVVVVAALHRRSRPGEDAEVGRVKAVVRDFELGVVARLAQLVVRALRRRVCRRVYKFFFFLRLVFSARCCRALRLELGLGFWLRPLSRAVVLRWWLRCSMALGGGVVIRH